MNERTTTTIKATEMLLMFRRVGWGKTPMSGQTPTIKIIFMNGNKGSICVRAFNYVIDKPQARVANDENTS